MILPISSSDIFDILGNFLVSQKFNKLFLKIIDEVHSFFIRNYLNVLYVGTLLTFASDKCTRHGTSNRSIIGVT